MRTIAGNRSLAVVAIGSILASVAFPADAVAQTTSIKAEYLMSSGPEDFHLRALPEPYVNLSIHTAPVVRPFP